MPIREWRMSPLRSQMRVPQICFRDNFLFRKAWVNLLQHREVPCLLSNGKNLTRRITESMAYNMLIARQQATCGQALNCALLKPPVARDDVPPGVEISPS